MVSTKLGADWRNRLPVAAARGPAKRRGCPSNKGFTLPELLIVAVIFAVLAGVVLPELLHRSNDGTVCRAGFKFVRDRGLTQVLDERGRGIPCVTNKGS